MIPISVRFRKSGAEGRLAPALTRLPPARALKDRSPSGWSMRSGAGWLTSAFDSIPASKYGYKPTPVQQSVGYVAQHLENANYQLCSRFGGPAYVMTARDSLADTVKAAWPKDTLTARLKASFAYCDAAMANRCRARLARVNTFTAATSESRPGPASTTGRLLSATADRLGVVRSHGELPSCPDEQITDRRAEDAGCIALVDLAGPDAVRARVDESDAR